MQREKCVACVLPYIFACGGQNFILKSEKRLKTKWGATPSGCVAIGSYCIFAQRKAVRGLRLVAMQWLYSVVVYCNRSTLNLRASQGYKRLADGGNAEAIL